MRRFIDGQRIPLNAGDEYLIKSGTPKGGEVIAGARTKHCFGHRTDGAQKGISALIGNREGTRPNVLDRSATCHRTKVLFILPYYARHTSLPRG